MPSDRTCPRRLRELLYGPERTEQRVTESLLAERTLLAGLATAALVSPAGRELAVQEVTRAVSGLLGIDVLDVLLGGWKRHHDLRAAARRTLAAPEDHEIVELAAHVVELSEHPSVDILVDDTPVLTIPLHLSLTAAVDALVARVERGRLTRLHSGEVEVTARLKARDTTLAEAGCVLDAGQDIDLGDGVELLTRPQVVHEPQPARVVAC
jgi:hypothetical protein